MPTTRSLATHLANAEFWYVHSEGATFGPFTPRQMEELGKQGRLGPQTMVVPAGDTNWVPLASYSPASETIRTPTSAELSEIVGVGSV
jgi:GYF domain 2